MLVSKMHVRCACVPKCIQVVCHMQDQSPLGTVVGTWGVTTCAAVISPRPTLTTVHACARAYCCVQVRSRFADPASGKEDFRPLLSALKQLGFKLVQQDASNRMFVVWVLQKKAAVKPSTAAGIEWPTLRACVYKKR